MAAEWCTAVLGDTGARRHVFEPFVDDARAHIGWRLADDADRPHLVHQQLPDFLRDRRTLRLRLADRATQHFEALQEFRIGRLDATSPIAGIPLRVSRAAKT